MATRQSRPLASRAKADEAAENPDEAVLTAPATIYPWQQAVWQTLHAQGERMPHAILLHGQPGSGKVDFARAVAQSMLCQQPDADGLGCGACQACHWFVRYSHPDFRRIRPEALDAADAIESATDENGASEEVGGSSGSKVPSKDIRIEQIRSLSGFMNISTHRHGKRVVLLYPAEAMNAASANALLKMLEEPPPQTLFLLVSHQSERLLPTIVSRCRALPMPVPPADQARQWLLGQVQGMSGADASRWLSEYSGAPLAALQASQETESGTKQVLQTFLTVPSVEAALQCADKLQKSPVADFVNQQQRWLYDLFFVKKQGPARYYPAEMTVLSRLASRTDEATLLRLIDASHEWRRLAGHSLSPRLFLEQMFLEYQAAFR